MSLGTSPDEDARKTYQQALESFRDVWKPVFGAAQSAGDDFYDGVQVDLADDSPESLAHLLPDIFSDITPEDKKKFAAFGVKFMGPLSQARDALDLALDRCDSRWWKDGLSVQERSNSFKRLSELHNSLLAALKTPDLLESWDELTKDASRAMREAYDEAQNQETTEKQETSVIAVMNCWANWQQAFDDPGDDPGTRKRSISPDDDDSHAHTDKRSRYGPSIVTVDTSAGECEVGKHMISPSTAGRTSPQPFSPATMCAPSSSGSTPTVSHGGTI